MDEATAASSSAPSTEGPQDHIDGLLQRLPNVNSLNQKSPPNSVAGAPKRIVPWEGRAVSTAPLVWRPLAVKHRIWADCIVANGTDGFITCVGSSWPP